MAQFERILWLDREIRAGNYPNAKKLEEQFEVSRRTAYNDYRYLELQLNAPIAYCRLHKGWFYTDPTFALTAMLVSERELLAGWLAKRLVDQYLGGPFAESMADLLEKVLAAIPAGEQPDLAALETLVSFRQQSRLSCSSDLLVAIQTAVRRRQVVSIEYYSAHRNESSHRDIEPVHLLNAEGEWHCVAYCRLRGDHRQFLLSRISEWTVTGERFDPHHDFDLSAYLQQGLVTQHGGQVTTVVVRFSPYQARWVREREWHSSQQLEPQPDGSLVVRLEVTGLAEVKRWLMSYGAEVEVLEPTELRAAVVGELEKLHRLYRSP